MDDLLTINLRSIAKHEREHKGNVELSMIIEQAADEIERLRLELDELKDGRRAILPSSRKHALDLLTVAEAGVKMFET